MKPPGRLLWSGRDADIFEYGSRSVLRRSRAGRSLALEARTMDYLVMQRIDGRSMVEELGRSPWAVRRQADTLAMLHRRLHELPPPGFLPPSPVGEGASVVHLDLHPLNVLIGAAGPVVIDWTNACAGDPNVDVALAWLLMCAGEIPGGRLRSRALNVGRGLLTNRFLGHFHRPDVVSRLAAVAAWKATDPHLSVDEVESLWRAARRVRAQSWTRLGGGPMSPRYGRRPWMRAG